MTKYGYIRKDIPCSTIKQLSLVDSYGCDELVFEGNDVTVDTELKKIVALVENEDVIICASLQSMGKSIRKLENIFNQIKEKKVRLICLEEGIDTQKNSSFYDYFYLFLNYEKAMQSRITKESLNKSRQKGIRFGRPCINKKIVQRVCRLHEERKTLREIAEECDISLGTAHKYVSKYKKKVNHFKEENILC